MDLKTNLANYGAPHCTYLYMYIAMAKEDPGMAEADASEQEAPQAAEDPARSSKQTLEDAIGNLFSVSVCFYCGSTQHDIHDCTDASKPAIQKMLKELKERLTVEDAPDIEPPNTGDDRTGATHEDVSMGVEPPNHTTRWFVRGNDSPQRHQTWLENHIGKL